MWQALSDEVVAVATAKAKIQQTNRDVLHSVSEFTSVRQTCSRSHLW